MSGALHELIEGARDVSLTDLIGAIGIAALLLLPIALMEAVDENADGTSEVAASQSEEEQRRDAAARAVCADMLGADAAPIWLIDGSMRCGRRPTVIRTLSHFPERGSL